jgi:hypothetical protein
MYLDRKGGLYFACAVMIAGGVAWYLVLLPAPSLARCLPTGKTKRQPVECAAVHRLRDCLWVKPHYSFSRAATPTADFTYRRPAAIWLTADLQPSLRLPRADLTQAIFATRLRASAHCCFRSPAHAFAAVVASATKF